MTFTISALETKDHKCQGKLVCVTVSHSGDDICFGIHCPPQTPWQQHLGFSPRQTWEDSSASILSRWYVPFPVVNVAFSGQGDSILTQHTICLCCKMVKFDRFLFPLTSNVTMSHRPYPATEFTSVNFSAAEMSRFIMCSKNFPSSYCEFLTSNIFWCLLLRSHHERRRKERREGIFWCTGEMK